MKINFYTVIHKAIRHYLYNIAIDVGNHDFRDNARFIALNENVLKLLNLLREHGRHEETYIRPLIASKFNDIAYKLGMEHEEQEHELMTLETNCRRFLHLSGHEAVTDGLIFYRALNKFIGESLLHMEEEEATMEILQNVCSDEELMDVHKRILMSFSMEKMLQAISYMMPALNLEERLSMLKGMLMNATEETTAIILSKVEQALNSEHWLELKAFL
jgi:hypothetical protein